MPYLIDGHNLIPHVGLGLDQPDDESQLVKLLQEFCRLSRKQVEVFFDGAQPGQPSTRKFGKVTARFVRVPMQADDAIAARLKQLGGEARNWVLVSSDHRVQSEARSSGAQVLSSAQFSRLLREQIEAAKARSEHQAEPMSEQEIQDWLDVFGRKNR